MNRDSEEQKWYHSNLGETCQICNELKALLQPSLAPSDCVPSLLAEVLLSLPVAAEALHATIRDSCQES